MNLGKLEGEKVLQKGIGYPRGGCGSGRGLRLFAEQILIGVGPVWESVLNTESTVVGKLHSGPCPHTASDLAGKTQMQQSYASLPLRMHLVCGEEVQSALNSHHTGAVTSLVDFGQGLMGALLRGDKCPRCHFRTCRQESPLFPALTSSCLGR